MREEQGSEKEEKRMWAVTVFFLFSPSPFPTLAVFHRPPTLHPTEFFVGFNFSDAL